MKPLRTTAVLAGVAVVLIALSSGAIAKGGSHNRIIAGPEGIDQRSEKMNPERRDRAPRSGGKSADGPASPAAAKAGESKSQNESAVGSVGSTK